MEAHQLRMWQKDGEFLVQQSIAIWNVSDSIILRSSSDIKVFNLEKTH